MILNYRGTCPKDYKDGFGRGCKTIKEESSRLLASTKDMTGVFHMETEQLGNLTRWRDLSQFLGYDNCEATKVARANKNKGYTPTKKRAKGMWSCG